MNLTDEQRKAIELRDARNLILATRAAELYPEAEHLRNFPFRDWPIEIRRNVPEQFYAELAMLQSGHHDDWPEWAQSPAVREAFAVHDDKRPPSPASMDFIEPLPVEEAPPLTPATFDNREAETKP